MVIFKSKQKKIEGDLKIKCCGKRLCPAENVKYLGVKTDINVSWQNHVNDFSLNWIEKMISFLKWENM